MKRLATVAIVTISAVLILCACGSKKTNEKESVSNVPTEAATEYVPTATREPIELPFEMPAETTNYEDVIQKYCFGINSLFDINDYQSNYMSILFSRNYYQYGIDNIGYKEMDINNDGINELLIGFIDDLTICDMYTMIDGKLKQLFVSNEDNMYYLDKDNKIYKSSSDTMSKSGDFLYILKDGKLVLEEGILCDTAADYQNPYFLTTDEDWDSSNDKKMEYDDAMNKINDYSDNVIAIEFDSFLDYANNMNK